MTFKKGDYLKVYPDCKRCKGTGMEPNPEVDPNTGEAIIQECEECRRKRYDELDDYKMMTPGY